MGSGWSHRAATSSPRRLALWPWLASADRVPQGGPRRPLSKAERWARVKRSTQGTEKVAPQQVRRSEVGTASAGAVTRRGPGHEASSKDFLKRVCVASVEATSSSWCHAQTTDAAPEAPPESTPQLTQGPTCTTQSKDNSGLRPRGSTAFSPSRPQLLAHGYTAALGFSTERMGLQTPSANSAGIAVQRHCPHGGGRQPRPWNRLEPALPWGVGAPHGS